MITPSQPENFILQYSPRTIYNNTLESEETLYKELKLNFDPITIKIVKKHFKERLGILTKEDFIAILKNHLLAFQPNNPNRENILIRLLSRLFSDIDLNDNGTLEWNEFTNYIIHSSNAKDKSQNNKDYRLKFYSPSPYCIKPADLSEIISYAFFIEKYNVIGVVQEGKSTIVFFDVKKCKKLKCFIELKEIQPMIDVIEFSELAQKAEQILAKEEANKKLNRSKIFNKFDKKDKDNSNNNNSLSEEDKSSKLENKHKLTDRRNVHPSSSFKLLAKEEMFKSNAFRKLSIICAIFIPEYDLILVSGTNNTITSWHFNGGEIKNVNATHDFVLCHDEI